jgi:HAE1 family hydrophobic/amphiphilic exporter-1
LPARIDGVGDVQVFGAGEYSMRIWLDPRKLKARDLTTQDVVAAIREQNVQVAAGIVGQPPAPKGQAFQYTVTTLGRLTDVEQFEKIIVKTGEDGRRIRVQDVARVELGTQTYNLGSRLNGQPAATVAVFQLPGANLLEISDAVQEAMDDLSRAFPEGVKHVIAYDAADVIRASIREIVETLFIAALLVILTVYVFLQDIRATIIPAVTIPVSLIGTFLVMGLLGFSLNALTLFGLVLAIGIVVDDAIVVVENVARNIDTLGLAGREAAIKAMNEVTGPIIATTLVLLAVFIPTAFMGGLTGMLYNQFALTIATATVFSSINALTLSPALCAILIVEFAREKRASGLGIAEAAVEAARLRFRPILMTAFSFILGVIPLLIATGAGAASRQSLGTAVFGGMLIGTILGVFFTPALYRMVQGVGEKLRGR